MYVEKKTNEEKIKIKPLIRFHLSKICEGDRLYFLANFSTTSSTGPPGL